MKIVHLVLGKANPDRMNGVNKVVNQLATVQHKSGLDVEVWGISASLVHDYGSRPYTTLLFKKTRNPFAISESLRKAFSSNSKPTVLHLHGAWIPCFPLVSKCASQNEIKIILTPHGGYNEIAMKKNFIGKKIYFPLFEKRLLSRVTTVHCLGASELKGLKKFYPNKNQSLIPYGFTFQHKKATSNHNQEKKALVVGFVGRIDIHTKGLDILIEAFSTVNQKSRLWIIGDGQDTEALKQLILKHNLEDRVDLFGSRFGQEKDDLIEQMDVFVHPSRNEGLPSAVIEACSKGVPAIVSKETNIAQYVINNNSGLALNKNQPADLSQAINIFSRLSSIEQTRLRNNAMHMVNTDFSWDKIISDMNAMYLA